jgi:hypothetical protein
MGILIDKESKRSSISTKPMKNDSSPSIVDKITNENDVAIEEGRSRTNPFIIFFFLVICIAIASVSGYAAWYLVQPQSGDAPFAIGSSKSNQ